MQIIIKGLSPTAERMYKLLFLLDKEKIDFGLADLNKDDGEVSDTANKVLYKRLTELEKRVKKLEGNPLDAHSTQNNTHDTISDSSTGELYDEWKNR
jgi:hypothetical protein